MWIGSERLVVCRKDAERSHAGLWHGRVDFEWVWILLLGREMLVIRDGFFGAWV